MILLTGATGFLGSRLLRELINEKYEVICIKRSTSNCSRVQDMLSLCKWHDDDKDDMEGLFRDNEIDTIIHCATNYGRNPEEYIEVYESNLAFPLRLIKYALKFECRYFINTDTFFVREIKNLWKNNEHIYMNAYVKSKYVFTNIVKDQIDAFGLAFINLQMEHIYGPDDGKGKFVNYLMKNLMENVTAIELTEGKQKRDWIYIEDAISAYIVILKKRKVFAPGAYYNFEVGTGVETSLREFAETLKKLTNSTTRLEFGKREMNPYELQNSCANNKDLCRLGWRPCYDIQSGMVAMIKESMK